MRTQQDQQELLHWLHLIGNGLSEENDFEEANFVKIPEKNRAKTLLDLMSFCYPDELFTNPLKEDDQIKNAIAKSAILCPINAGVEDINKLALSKMIGEVRDYLSIDEPLAYEDNTATFRADNNLEAVHLEMPSGFPPHSLKLKVIFILLL